MVPVTTHQLCLRTQPPPAPGVFQADWPEGLSPTLLHKITRLAWTIFSVIVFPIGIYYLIRIALLHGVIAPCVLPAAGKKDWGENGEDLDMLRNDLKTRLSAENIAIQTPDGATLDAMFCPGSSQKVVLYVFGNMGCYEKYGVDVVNEIRRLAGDDIGVLLFNPRGVNRSVGSFSLEGLPLDAYSAAEYLIHEKNILPRHLLFYGHSLGGAYGAIGAHMTQLKYPNEPISIVNDRSFSHIAKVVDEKLTRLGRAVVLMLWTFGFNLDPRKAWNELKGRKIVVCDKKDEVICYPSSFDRFAKRHTSTENAWRVKLRSSDDEFFVHSRRCTDEEAAALGYQMRLALDLPSWDLAINRKFVKPIKI